MTAFKRLVGTLGLAALVAASLDAQSLPLQPLMVVRLDPGPASQDPRTQTPDPGHVTPDPGSATQDPTHPLTPLPVTRLDDPGASATLDEVRPFSLRISEPLPVQDVLLMLVRDTGLSLVTEPGIDAEFVGELKDVSLRQAFELVLRSQGLDYKVEGTAIRVFRRRTETRFFDVNVALTHRSSEGWTGAASSLPESANGSRAAVRWQVDADPLGGIASGIRSLVSADGRFSLDRAAGVAQVTDYPERLDRIAIYLESVERRLNRQVDIQAQVVEVTLFDPSSTGVNWSAAVDKARTANAPGGSSINFDAFVEALGEQGRVTVLASPRLQALHNEPALMRVGIQDVTFVRRAEASGDGEWTRSLAVPVLGGFTLALTAHITADGMVTMSVAPSVTQPTGESRSLDWQSAPVVAIDELSAAVRLRDGETLVLPGLRRDRDRQVNAASKGLIGLFRREQTERTHSELAVLLTPTIRR